MKKVTGGMKISLGTSAVFALLLLSNLSMHAQEWTGKEGDWLMTTMSRLQYHIGRYEVDSAREDLSDFIKKAESFNKPKDNKKEEALMAIHCAMNFSIDALSEMNKGLALDKVILEGEQCLERYQKVYRQKDELFTNADLEYNTTLFIAIMYRIEAQRLKNSKFYKIAFDWMNKAEGCASNGSNWKHHFTEVWKYKAENLYDLGNDIEADLYNSKVVAFYDSLGMDNYNDTSEYIQSTNTLIRQQWRTASLDDRLKNIKKLKLLLNSQELRSGRVNLYLKLDVLSKEAHIYTMMENYKSAEMIYLEIQRMIEKSTADPVKNPYNMMLQSSRMELYVKLREWENVIELAGDNGILNKLFDLNSDLLEAYINTRDTISARNLVEQFIQNFKLKCSNLESLSAEERDQFIRSSRLDFSLIKPFFFWQRQSKKDNEELLNIHVLYKGLSLESRGGKLNLKKMDTVSYADAIRDRLKDDELYIDVVYIDPQEKEKRFFYVGTGLQYSLPDSIKDYPIIVKLVPFSNAFSSENLYPGDTVLKINGRDMYRVSAEDFKRYSAAIPKGEKMEMELSKKNIDGTPVIVSIEKDSIFKWELSLREIFAYYSVSKDKGIEAYFREGWPIRMSIKHKYRNAISAGDKISLQQDSLLPINFIDMSGIKRIYASIDGLYNKINLETVTVKDRDGNFRYLGDLYDIRLVSSGRDIISTSNSTFTNKTITLFGYPDYTLNKSEQAKLVKQVGIDCTTLTSLRGSNSSTGNYKFNSLPATKDEVDEIGKMLEHKGWQVQVYTGAKALEEQVKNVHSPRVLHIATHGFFAEDINLETQKTFMGIDSKDALNNPMLRSGLAFVGAERTRTDTLHEALVGMDDGILTAEEVQNLDLKGTELVVLSACETGLGEISNGEGVMGLQRAFRVAGAKSVLMSLWNVNDAATEELMKSFYKHWLVDGLSKQDALWQAKLDLRKNPKYDTPYYWGAFVLIGE